MRTISSKLNRAGFPKMPLWKSATRYARRAHLPVIIVTDRMECLIGRRWVILMRKLQHCAISVRLLIKVADQERVQRERRQANSDKGAPKVERQLERWHSLYDCSHPWIRSGSVPDGQGRGGYCPPNAKRRCLNLQSTYSCDCEWAHFGHIYPTCKFVDFITSCE